MKVRDLIELLEDMDPEADVFIMSQQSWPFENAVAGVCTREDFAEPEPEEEGEPWAKRDRWGASDQQLPASDVFIVEGEQLRYGSERAWEVTR